MWKQRLLPRATALAVMAGFAMAGLASPASAFIPPSEPPPQADLVCQAKVADTDALIEGQATEVFYTITVKNQGPDPATGVIVTDIPPEGNDGGLPNADYDDAATDIANAANICSGTDTLVTCNLGNLDSGQTSSVKVVVDISNPLVGDLYVNSASVAAASPADPNPGNNDGTICEVELTVIAVLEEFDVACVEKTASDDQFFADQLPKDLTYTVMIVNNGPSPASGVTIEDTLPAGVAFVTGMVDDDDVVLACTEAGGLVTCPGNGGLTLDPDEAATATIVVNVPGGTQGLLVNSALVPVLADETNEGNNSGAQCVATTTIEERPPGGDGCTPGGWRNHFDAWGFTDFTPTDDFFTVFGVEPPRNLTGLVLGETALGEKDGAIWLGGGGFKKLARHSTACILNATSTAVDYDLTEAQCIAIMQGGGTAGGTTIDDVVDFNEQGCDAF